MGVKLTKQFAIVDTLKFQIFGDAFTKVFFRHFPYSELLKWNLHLFVIAF